MTPKQIGQAIRKARGQRSIREVSEQCPYIWAINEQQTPTTMSTQTTPPVKFIIPAKMSGTGTIHDYESEHYDREVEFADGAQYALVFAAYYNRETLYFWNDGDAAEALKEHEDYTCCLTDTQGMLWAYEWNDEDGYSLGPSISGYDQQKFEFAAWSKPQVFAGTNWDQ